MGDLTYAYDAAGNRIRIGGTWARTGLPATLSSTTYDAANEITQWGGTAFSYDANGNLTNDGTKIYTWNARNQLAGLSGATGASFAYDAVGRRRGKTISGTTTNFLYDGLNLVQEQSAAGTPTANLLTGLDIDEAFTRSDAAGTSSLLRDALGSTTALADPSGTVQTDYTFEPFGSTTVSGAASTNPVQYTARDNDGDIGLFYYRARYYIPVTGRFISEDPTRFSSGINFYRYVTNNPLSFSDPFGLVNHSWTEQETLAKLQDAYNDATAGRIEGLKNINDHSQGGGDYDFGHRAENIGDRFTRCGVMMRPDEFGNYMAGFESAAYDQHFRWTTGGGGWWAEGAAELVGIVYHLKRDTDAPNDPWDTTGRPWIVLGERDGWNFGKRNGKCGCQK